jgi:hypothetical protein
VNVLLARFAVLFDDENVEMLPSRRHYKGKQESGMRAAAKNAENKPPTYPPSSPNANIYGSFLHTEETEILRFASL